MLKKLKILGCILLLFCSCNEENTYRIKVNLSNLDAQNIFVVFEAAESKHVDTLWYDGKGAFVITQKQDDYRTLTLFYENFTRWITVYLETPQRIAVTGDALYPGLIQVKGGRINELLSDFRKGAAALLKEQANLLNANGMIQEWLPGNTIKTARLTTINHELRIQAEAFIQENPDEEASAILIREYFADPNNPLLIDNLLDVLHPRVDDFYVVRDLKTYTEKAKQTIVGSKAPDFNVFNLYGQTFSRDSFSNRYFILAFTTMWNDMCQIEELHLDEIISSFSKDSLKVMIVSLDENPQELRTLLHLDPIQWNIVTDSIGQAIELLDVYNINVLPRCFLMDKEGMIILKTENGVELKHKLEQLIPRE
jgi:peroxiredoxin